MFSFTHEAHRVKSRKHVPHPRNLVICGSELILTKLFFANLSATLFVREISERNQVKELVNELDDGAVFFHLMGDSMRNTIGRNEDERNSRALVERQTAGHERGKLAPGVVES